MTSQDPSAPCHGHGVSQATSSTAVASSTATKEHHVHDGRVSCHSTREHNKTSGICCWFSHDTSTDLSLSDGDSVGAENYDIEHGPPSFERVVLLVDGLQCGCCEGGIDRVLSRIPAVRNHQVNTVLARVEFELDTSGSSVKKIISKLNSKTGYKFEELNRPVGQILELLVTHGVNLHIVDRPSGVTHIEVPERGSWVNTQIPKFQDAGDPQGKDDNPSRLIGIMNGLSYLHRSVSSALHTGLVSPKLEKYLVQVHYEADQIGARDIFDYYLTYDLDLRLAPSPAHPSLAIGARQTRRASFYFIPALFCTIPVVVFAWAPVDRAKVVYLHLSLALATIVQCIAIKEFLPSSLRSLWYLGIFEMDLLIAISSTIAYTFSVVSYAFQISRKPLQTGSFFEASTLLVTLILLGRVINEYARYMAAKSVSFRSLQNDEALLVLSQFIHTADPITRCIDCRLLQYGDCFKVPPHSKVVTDGAVLSGGSEIDESMITGESVPVAKGVHSTVFAGTTNGDGTLIVQLTTLPHENSVHRIAAMVEDAELTKPRAQALADSVAAWFVPIMAGIGCTVFVAWLLVNRLQYKFPWKIATIHALSYAIATLIVSCPCAIGLAVPMVVLIAGGVAARFGIIFRDPQKLEVARSVTDVIFDKTGTLTCGTLTVVGETWYGTVEQQNEAKRILLSLLRDIKHPVAIGVLLHLEMQIRMSLQELHPPVEVVNVSSIPGCGVEAKLKESNQIIRAGNPDWLNVELSPSNCTTICVKLDNDLVTTFQLRDRPRRTAGLVIQELHARNIRTHMISGDSQGAVDDIAHTLNIPKLHTKSRCTPEGKRNYIHDLQQPGKTILFIGDGTNDSPALKQAHIGVHITQASSSHVAQCAADVVLMTPRLHSLLILLDISRAAYRRIVLNFSWSALYNITAILLAAGAFTKVMEKARIAPQWAGLGELVSVLPVVGIAWQMRWRDYGRRYRAIEYDYMRVEAQEEGRVVRTRSVRSSGVGDEKGVCCGYPVRGRKRE